jgi:hypothetical protein
VNNIKAKTKRTPPAPEQVRAEQKRQAEADHAKLKATLPAKVANTAVAMPDNRTPVQQYLDEVAPASIVGRLIKFSKDHQFETADDGEPIGDDVDFIALADQCLVGWIKFNGDGEPPDRVAGLLYDGFIMPPRETLGDDDQSQWEDGLDGKPADPWQHQMALVLQRGDSGELYTLATTTKTGRRAIGNLLRHYDRMERAKSNMYPLIRLKVGGFNHRDERIGWVAVPVLAVVGRAPKESAARPDSSLKADLSDAIPF